VLAADVGYELMLTKRLFDSIDLQQNRQFWIHTHVREDALILFGFLSEKERSFFRLLLGVSGLGPKMALSLLSTHSPTELCHYILNKDEAQISRAPGVGKKLASRMLIELSEKIEKLMLQPSWALLTRQSNETSPSLKPSLKTDLLSALSNLGYHPQQIKPVLDNLMGPNSRDDLSFEMVLKLALKEMSRYTINRHPEESGNA